MSGVDDCRNYHCELCDEAYDSESELPFHVKNCHKEEIQNGNNICWVCLKFFDSNEAVISHIKVCHLYSAPNAKRIERETFICDHCSQIFFNKTFLINHIWFSHMKKYCKGIKIVCHICNQEKTLHQIWHHIRAHKVLSVSFCHICFMKCKDLKDLALHQEQHVHYLHCDMCSFETKKRLTFMEHVYNHDKKAENNESKIDDIELQRIFMPEIRQGPLSLSRISNLIGIRIPSEIKICILCREICTNLEEMNQHYINHRLLSQKNNIKSYYICECGQEFPNNILLRQHKLQEKKLKMGEISADILKTYEPRRNKRLNSSNENEEHLKRQRTNDCVPESFHEASVKGESEIVSIRLDLNQDHSTDSEVDENSDNPAVEQDRNIVAHDVDQETATKLFESSGVPVTLENGDEGYVLFIVQ